MNLGPCVIKGCENKRRVRSEICATCARNHYYWKVRVKEAGPQVLTDRLAAVEKWRTRMIYWGAKSQQNTLGVRNAIRSIERRKAA